mmetsp:Transcript_8015/g.18722  ORF Transcript_8015/g.18722 Transcript_8015/m.18722 type:complete len:455 (+) Transcript_8015:95-1459(+)
MARGRRSRAAAKANAIEVKDIAEIQDIVCKSLVLAHKTGALEEVLQAIAPETELINLHESAGAALSSSTSSTELEVAAPTRVCEKKVSERAVRRILHRYGENLQVGMEKDLSDEDDRLMRRVLQSHPNRVDKEGPGVKRIVAKSSELGTCFAARRTDGSVADFAWRSCFKNEHRCDQQAKMATKQQEEAWPLSSVVGLLSVPPPPPPLPNMQLPILGDARRQPEMAVYLPFPQYPGDVDGCKGGSQASGKGAGLRTESALSSCGKGSFKGEKSGEKGEKGGKGKFSKAAGKGGHVLASVGDVPLEAGIIGNARSKRAAMRALRQQQEYAGASRSSSHPAESAGAIAGNEILGLLQGARSGGSRRTARGRGDHSDPKPLSKDEFLLVTLESREDADMGADRHNFDTFGEVAGPGGGAWDFDAMLEANRSLTSSASIVARRKQLHTDFHCQPVVYQ